MRLSYDHYTLLQALHHGTDYHGVSLATFEEASRQGHIVRHDKKTWNNVAITPLGKAILDMAFRSSEENGQIWFDLEPESLECKTVIAVTTTALERFIRQVFNRAYDIDKDTCINWLPYGGLFVIMTNQGSPAYDKPFQNWLNGKPQKGSLLQSIIVSLALSGHLVHGEYHILRS